MASKRPFQNPFSEVSGLTSAFIDSGRSNNQEIAKLTGC